MTAHDSFCAQDVPVVGFMSGGMVIDTVSEGFCNYLSNVGVVGCPPCPLDGWSWWERMV